MSDEERRTVVVTAAVLLVASLIRFVWESRPVPPILPPSEVPEALVEETREAVEREERMATPLAEGEKVDPNQDPEVELARLPGVGPALASRIVATREAEGGFRRPSDLLRVSGIGPATLERIESHLDLSDSPRSTRAPPLPTSSARRTAPASPNIGRGLVDLNRASADELEALPGVGPTLAGRIVEHRTRVGRFSGIEELSDVAGIGDATVERLRPLVRAGR